MGGLLGQTGARVTLMGFAPNGTLDWHQQIGSGIGGMPTLSIAGLSFGTGMAGIDLDGQAPLDLAISATDGAAASDTMFLCVLSGTTRQVLSHIEVKNG